jgi:hypothetical protein
MVVQMGLARAYVKYDGRKLKYYMFSDKLPPLFVVGGTKSSLLMKILREEFGSFNEDYIESINLKPLTIPGILVWIVASISTAPSKDLLHALIGYTPRATVELIFGLIDASNGYKKNRPLIPSRKLRTASKIIVQILKLLDYPVG